MFYTYLAECCFQQFGSDERHCNVAGSTGGSADNRILQEQAILVATKDQQTSRTTFSKFIGGTEVRSNQEAMTVARRRLFLYRYYREVGKVIAPYNEWEEKGEMPTTGHVVDSCIFHSWPPGSSDGGTHPPIIC